MMNDMVDPPNNDYKGILGECAICGCVLELENIHEDNKYIHGLGDLCLNCYLKEVELESV